MRPSSQELDDGGAIPTRIRVLLAALVTAAQASGMTRGELMLVALFLVLGMMAWADEEDETPASVWPLVRDIFACDPDVDGERRDMLVRMLIPLCLGEGDPSVH